jgi:hypothetical protein
MTFWKRLTREQPPSPEALEELRASQQEYNAVVSRGPKVAQMASWLETRQRDNHFGDDLSITFTRRGRHA